MRDFIKQIRTAIYDFFSLFHQGETEPEVYSVDHGHETIMRTIREMRSSYETIIRSVRERDERYKTIMLELEHLNINTNNTIEKIDEWRIYGGPSDAFFRRGIIKEDGMKAFAKIVTALDKASYAIILEDYPEVKVDDDFFCCISQNIMKHPVYDPAYPEQKYDLLMIRGWLDINPTNPCTRTPLSIQNLVYDEGLKLRIDRFMHETSLQTTSSFSPIS